MLNLNHPFLFYIKKFKGSFCLGLVALLFTNGFDILGPYIIGRIIDAMSDATLNDLSLSLFLLLCVSIGTGVFRYLWRIYFGYFHHSVAADLRKLLFKKLIGLGQNFHQKTPIGEKMTLITQDIENFRMGIGPGLLIFFDAVIYVLGLIPLMLLIDVSWTLKCLALMPLIPFVVYSLETKLSESYRQLQDESGELTSFTQETISGIKVIKSLGLNSLRSHLFERTNQRLRDYGIKMDRIESAFGPTLEFFIMIGTATLLFVGAEKVVSQQVSIGSFFAFYQYLLRMIWPMTALGFSFMMYKEADSSFDRIKDVLIKEPWLKSGEQIPSSGKSLSVRNLFFKYPEANENALENITFDLLPNESMAIVGSVGSGKTTLVQILASILPPNDGHVFYDNRTIETYDRKLIKKIITLVPQKQFLFKKSIRDNLLDFSFIESPDSPSLIEILEDAHIKDEVCEMKEKENTLLEENGQGLSGGQKQRLTMARGLSLKPQWLILDDTLSAVDIETEQKILKSLQLKKLKSDMNFIFCSHRIQNLSWVDKILVLKQGHVLDIGTHNDLYIRCEHYRKLYSSQKTESKFGLANL